MDHEDRKEVVPSLSGREGGAAGTDHARLRLAIGAANVGLWDWDLRTNTVFFSPEWKRQIGYEDHELGNGLSEWEERVHPEDLERTLRTIKAFIEHPWDDYHVEFRFRHRDGSYRWILCQAALELDDEGRAVRMLGSHVDVTERRRADEALLAAHRRQSAILEATSDGFVALDGGWRYTYVNSKAAAIFGRSPEDLVGKHIWTEFPEGVDQPFHKAYLRVLATQVAEVLEEYYPPWSRWYENRIYPFEDGVAIYFTDVTARRRAKMMVKGQNQVLEMVVRGAPLGEILDALVRIVEEQFPGMLASILLLDPDGQRVRHGAAPSLPREYWSAIDGEPIGPRAGACGTAVFRREQVIVEDIAVDPLWAGDRDLALAHGLRACWSTPIFDRAGTVLGTFAMYYRAPGRPFQEQLDAIEAVTHTAAVAISRSIEEGALRQSQERLRLFIEHAPAALAMFDEQMRYLAVSRRWLTDYGLDGADVHGRSHYEIFPEITEEWRKIHRRAMTGEVVRADDDVFVRADGTMRWLRWEVRPWFLRDDVVGGIVIFSEDVTERKRAELDLQELNAELEQRIAARTRELEAAMRRAQDADRVKSAFLATMSHELRTPLNSVIGFTGVLLQELPGPLNEEQRRQLGMVQNGARHLLELINDVLDLSKIEAGQLGLAHAPFPLAEVVETVGRSVAPQARAKGLALHVRVDPGTGLVVSDRRRVAQILLNVAGNAIKFTDAGSVHVTCAVVGEGRWVEVSVEDTGIGIHPGDLDRVFRPFQQVDGTISRHHEGTGLGLAISRSLADLLGGTLTVRSTPGTGSTFTLRLPRDAETL